MLEYHLVAQRTILEHPIAFKQLQRVLTRHAQLPQLGVDGGQPDLQHLGEFGRIPPIKKAFDIVERRADALQLLDHVHRRALLVGVVAIPRGLVDANGIEQPLLMIEPQRFLRHAVQFGHAADAELPHRAQASSRLPTLSDDAEHPNRILRASICKAAGNDSRTIGHCTYESRRVSLASPRARRSAWNG